MSFFCWSSSAYQLRAHLCKSNIGISFNYRVTMMSWSPRNNCYPSKSAICMFCLIQMHIALFVYVCWFVFSISIQVFQSFCYSHCLWRWPPARWPDSHVQSHPDPPPPSLGSLTKSHCRYKQTGTYNWPWVISHAVMLLWKLRHTSQCTQLCSVSLIWPKC